MRNRKYISRILAMVCALALVVGSVKLHDVAASEETTSDKSAPIQHTILGVEAFTGQDSYTIAESNAQFQASAGTLDGMMVDGIYKWTGNNIINIGGKDRGVHIDRQGDALRFLFVDNRGSGDVRYTNLLQVTASDAGCTLFDADVRIKVGVQFLTEVTDDGEVDVRFTINVGSAYEKVITVESLLASNMERRFYINSQSGGSLTVKKAIVHEQLGFVDFGITEDYTYADGYTILSAGSGTLENVAIDGVYNFSGRPSIWFGQNNGMRLQLHVDGNYHLSCQFLDSQQNSYRPDGESGVYTAKDIGCNYLNSDVRIKVQFTVTNKNAEAGTVDLAIKVNIGPTWEKTITVNGLANANLLTRTLGLSAKSSAGSSITLKAAMPTGVEVTPADMGIADGIYKYKEAEEDATTAGYSVIGVESFIGQDSKKLSGSGELGRPSSGAGNLNGIMVDGIYHLSGRPIINIGWIWGGIQLQREGTSSGIRYMFFDLNGQGALHVTDIDEEDTKCTIWGNDIRISAGFNFISEIDTKQTSDAGDDTVDVEIKLCIGEHEDVFQVTGVRLANLQRRMYLYGNSADASITLKKKVIENRAISVSGTLANSHTQTESVLTLGNKVFAADVQFFGTASELVIGGTSDNIWSGVSFRRKSDNLFAVKSSYGLSEILIPAEKVGLRSTSEKFNLKISLAYEDVDSLGGENDVKYGVWINDKLYNNSYFYSYNATSKFGANALICCPSESGAVYIATATHYKSDNNTPYILEDFGLKNQSYDINTGLRNGSYSKEVGTIKTGGSSVTGKIALQGNANLTLYGAKSNVWYGLRFSIINNELAIQHTSPNVAKIDIRYSDIGANEEFTFTVSEELLDLDADGSADDIRLGIWVNGTLYKEQYYYLLDFTEISRTALVYVGNQQTSHVTVKPSVTVESYDLAETENGYLVNGKGTITVNNVSAANGDIINTPGDYIIRCADKGAYVKYVALYKSGDAHTDNQIDVLDLVAAKKAGEGTADTVASKKAADIDRNNVVSDGDCETLRNALAGIVTDTGIEEEYLRLDFADFGISDGYKYAGGGKAFSAGDGTLDEVMIDGVYHFTGTMSVDFGGSWSGLQLQREANNTLRYQFIDLNGSAAAQTKNVTAADTGCQIFETDVRIRVGFKFISEVDDKGTESTTDDTVDVEIKVCIGDTYEDTLKITGARVANLQRKIYLYAKDNIIITGSSAITCKEVVLEDLFDKVSSLSYEDGVMPIGSFYGPHRLQDTTKNQSYDFITDEIYQLIQNVGVNLMTVANMDYNTNAKAFRDSLVLAEKYGIGMYVADSRYSGTLDAVTLANHQKEFAQYQSYKGVMVVDEPFTDVSGRYQAGKMMYEYFDKALMLNNYSNTFSCINIGPMGKDGKSALYKEHVYEILKPNAKIASWDYYIYDTVTGNQGYANVTDYFRSIVIMRKMAMERNIPFWGYVQAGSNWEKKTNTDNSTPSEAELLWNVNTQLAYGVKGIQYFPLIQPAGFAYDDDGYDYERNGLIGANGVPTKWYYYAKEANKQIAAVDEYLMYAKSKDILAVGSTAQTQTGIKKNTYGNLLTGVTASDGALIGVFDYQGKTAFYVVNYDSYDDNSIDATYQGDEAADEITLTFGSAKNYSVVSTQLGAATTTTSGSTCTLNLKNGGAALVILE